MSHNQAGTWLYVVLTMVCILIGFLGVYRYHSNKSSKTQTALTLTLGFGGFFIHLQGFFDLLDFSRVADLVTAVVGLLVLFGGLGYTAYSYSTSGS